MGPQMGQLLKTKIRAQNYLKSSQSLIKFHRNTCKVLHVDSKHQRYTNTWWGEIWLGRRICERSLRLQSYTELYENLVLGRPIEPY